MMFDVGDRIQKMLHKWLVQPHSYCNLEEINRVLVCRWLCHKAFVWPYRVCCLFGLLSSSNEIFSQFLLLVDDTFIMSPLEVNRKLAG